MDPFFNTFRCLCGAYYSGSRCEKFNTSIFICSKLGLCRPLGPYLFGFSIIIFLCILVIVGHGCCLLLDKLLKCKITQTRTLGSVHHNNNNNDFNNESRNQRFTCTLNRMIDHNPFVLKPKQHVNFSNIRNRIHFNRIKSKCNCFICDHVSIPLNETSRNHQEIVDLTRPNKSQYLLKHNEVKSQNHFSLHPEPIPTLFIKKSNYSNELHKIPENNNPYLNDTSYSSNETKASMKAFSFKPKARVHENHCGGYDNDTDNNDDDDDDVRDDSETNFSSNSENNLPVLPTSSRYQKSYGRLGQNTEYTRTLSTSATASCSNTQPHHVNNNKLCTNHFYIPQTHRKNVSIFKQLLQSGQIDNYYLTRQCDRHHHSVMKKTTTNSSLNHDCESTDLSVCSSVTTTKFTITKAATTKSVIGDNHQSETMLQPLHNRKQSTLVDTPINSQSAYIASHSRHNHTTIDNPNELCMEYDDFCNSPQTPYL
ncbi:unnamed protein product [Schistosoma turkestanicum]|nr:unnamed protein product [Schistosoma turkestanicum]